MEERIFEIQDCLNKQKVDGWLLFDNHGSNRFARELLTISPEAVLTRRFFYWIPSFGEPVKIVHQIEAECLDHLPGKKIPFLAWKDLERALKGVLTDKHVVAMEYSPRNAIPYVSVVDAGIMELVKSFGVEVVSSADLLQYFTSVLTPFQVETHKEAAEVIQETLSKAWDLITDHVRQGKKITEYDVQQFILSEFTVHNCISEDGPTCSVNEHTAHPHYIATRSSTKMIERGDFVMIDLWCKKNIALGVYADITRVGILAPEPTPHLQEIFDVVKQAQDNGILLIQNRLGNGEVLKGCEVDDACRGVIENAGFGEYFTHRTGHNIDTNVHGSGAHLDNLETADERRILPGTCFSIEPGIYLPNEFGVRIETNLVIGPEGNVEITGGKEESILCLL